MRPQNHHHSPEREQQVCHPQKFPCTLCSLCSFLLFSFPGGHQSVIVDYFALSRIFYKQNHAVYSLVGFFQSNDYFEISRVIL